MPQRLEGRLALVTGGTGQLGRHVVARLLEGGAKIHVPVFRKGDPEAFGPLLREADTEIRLHPETDLTDSERVQAVVAEIHAEEGRGPEILVNLAGGFWMGPVEETPAETWDLMWKMNATTAFLCAKAVFPGMKSQSWGRIVNVSAFPAIERGKTLLSAYGAAKSAVLNLTQTLAREGVGHGISVNAILPSIVDTRSNREAMPDADTSTWLPPSDIADVVAFLVSEPAGIINGAAIPLTLG